jgi:DNA-binding NarL/FixJ family response regulator
MVLVGEGQDGSSAVALAVQHTPDVMILDVEMPGRPVQGTIVEVGQASPATRVILLSQDGDPAEAALLLALAPPVRGYLVKDCGWHQLLGAIHEIMQEDDRTVLASSRTALERVMDRFRSNGIEPPVLSDQVLEVLQLAAQGMTDREIGEVLHIGEATVRRRLADAYRALGANSRLSAILHAVARGLVDPPPGAVADHSSAHDNGQVRHDSQHP